MVERSICVACAEMYSSGGHKISVCPVHGNKSKTV